MSGTILKGIKGTNPLGFFAALGIQVVFASESEQPRLWWSDDVIPCAVVDLNFTIERVADQALETFVRWKDSPAMTPQYGEGSFMTKGDELKLTSADLRTYLAQVHGSDSVGALATALVAEGSLDNQEVSKPSDLYFTAGQQKFLKMARDILGGVSEKDLLAGFDDPWKYDSTLPSLMWDITDDRVYALLAKDPSTEKKLTNPGPEALAVLGLSLHPVFADKGRTLTQGCSGSWKAGYYSWPIWSKPASLNAVRSFLAHAYEPTLAGRHRWFRSWGIEKVLRSPIRRSSQGGYGTFGPPEIIWQAS